MTEAQGKISGHERDLLFGEGFIKGLCESDIEVLGGMNVGDRPVARLSSPLNWVKGDAVALVRHPVTGGQLLIIAERESSGPGNERNALKWFEAVTDQAEMRIRGGGRDKAVHPDSTVVLMAFGPSKSWSRSDCEKTIAFTERLKAHLNGLSGDALSIEVQGEADVVDNWKKMGRDHAKKLARKLRE